MPGYDGTGPMGMGPRTGGGFGYCPPAAGYTAGAAPVMGLGRGGYPRGGGRGFGWGGGRGFARGRGRGLGFAPAPYGAPAYGAYPFGQAAGSREEELEMLKQDAAAAEQQLEAIRARISELEQS